MTAVSIAVFKQHYECLKLLVKAGADLDLYTNNYLTPLFFAIKNKDLKSVILLVKNGAKPYFTEPPEMKDNSPIFMAVRFQFIEALEVLCEEMFLKK